MPPFFILFKKASESTVEKRVSFPYCTQILGALVEFSSLENGSKGSVSFTLIRSCSRNGIPWEIQLERESCSSLL